MQAQEMNESQAMMDLVFSYWRSQVVGVAAKLGIADLLAEKSMSADWLAKETDAEPTALYRLLRAAASVGVLEETAGRTFGLTPLGQTLRSNVPGSMRHLAISVTSEGHWRPWGALDRTVRDGQRSTTRTLGCEIFDYFAQHPDEASAFNAAMGNLSALAGHELAQRYELPKACTIVDVGGAHGIVLSALLAAHPDARGVLFDLPHVIETAPATLAAQGVADRTQLMAGDFFESVPSGGDVYVMKHILHDWSDTQAVTILTNCARAMNKDAKVILLEMLIPVDGSPSMTQMMDINMMVMVPGKERTEAEYAALFDAAGLRLARTIATASPFYILEAALSAR